MEPVGSSVPIGDVEYRRRRMFGLKLYNESLEINRKLGNQSGIAIELSQLGRLAEDQKDLDAAEKYYEQALQIFENLGIKPYMDIAKKDLERFRELKQKT